MELQVILGGEVGGLPIEPPEELRDRPDDDEPGMFLPADGLDKWVRSHIIEDGPLFNPDHEHLCDASIGFLWTNVFYKEQGRMIAGTAALGKPSGKPWSSGRLEQQLYGFFGEAPDFLIILDSVFFGRSANPTRLAVIEHELYHCSFAGFNQRTALPRWSIKGHDVEEFRGVVVRYGAEATGLTSFIEAGSREPLISGGEVAHVCGTCLR